jgi:hypothetical protein
MQAVSKHHNLNNAKYVQLFSVLTNNETLILQNRNLHCLNIILVHEKFACLQTENKLPF